MESLITSGHIADLVFVVMALEAVALFILSQFGVIALPFRAYIFGILAGGFIVFAMRLALTGETVIGIALALAFSFAAHIFEILSLVQRKKGDPNYKSSSYKVRSETQTETKKGL